MAEGSHSERSPEQVRRTESRGLSVEVATAQSGYDFSPAAHLRASAAAASSDVLPAVLPAFRVSTGTNAGPPHSISAEVRNELKSVETEVKYAGYLQQQQRAIERLKKAEQRNIPDWFDYGKISGLSREMHEKLSRVRPRTIGQALGIPGVTPAAVSLINIYIEIQKPVAGSRPPAAGL